jgi:serine/threonine protein kinase
MDGFCRTAEPRRPPGDGGVDLGTLIAHHGPMAPDRAVAIVEQLAAALDAAHARGVVHRDLTPTDVLVRPGPPDVVHLDVGVARATGSLGYMAPERFLNQPVGPPADVYALACILHELLAGSPPFTGDAEALFRSHLHAPLPPIGSRRPGVPPALDAVVAVGAAKHPYDRYPTAGALAAAARAALTTPPIPAQTVRTPHPSYAAATQVAPYAAAQPPYPGSPYPGPQPARRSRRPVVVAIVAAVVLAVTAGVGLWLAPSRTSTQARGVSAPVVSNTPTPVAPTAPAPSVSVVGSWIGAYTCGQGQTGLALEVEGSDEPSLSATFRFFALQDNPGVPSGSFSMTGSQFGSDVDLRGSTWIRQPTGYQLVDLDGQLSDDGTVLEGNVEDAGNRCTTFRLRRLGGATS